MLMRAATVVQQLCSGGAKVGPAGARAPAVKICAPAVPRQLAGRWAERVQQQPVDSKKSYLIIGTNLSFTFNLSATVRYNRCDSQSYLVLVMVIFNS